VVSLGASAFFLPLWTNHGKAVDTAKHSLIFHHLHPPQPPLAMSTRARHLVVSIARRHASSSMKDKVGTFQRRPKLPPSSNRPPNPPPAPPAATTPGGTGLPHDELVVEDAITLVSSDIKMRNAGLAALLLAFCFGVTLYSMNAVGQAGSDPNDPLSTLKKEAAEAQQRHDRETKSAQEASDMLQQFRAGQYDPDKYDEDDGSASQSPAKKRPWYKFW
jgi:hypothetical protein